MTEGQFWAYVYKPNRQPYCWEWRGAVDTSGYGAVRWDGKKINTHRLAWSLARGAIPAGLWVLHRCDNRICINPDHLFLGTRLDNARDCHAKGRMAQQSMTHCKRGHPLNGPDVYERKPGVRVCRQCKRITQRERYKKNPEKILAVNRRSVERRKLLNQA